MKQQIKTFFAGSPLARAVFGVAMAGPFEKGRAAYQKGDFATALSYWQPLAERGCVGAQFNLGLMNANGRGVPQDHVQAAAWYRKAAEQGDGRAQFNLGLMNANGQGVRPRKHKLEPQPSPAPAE